MIVMDTKSIRNRVLVSRPNIERRSEKGNARKGFASRAELNRIIAHLPDYLEDLVLFAFLSSWRRREILSLSRSDVDGDTIRLRAEHSKEREARSLALEGELAGLIARRQAQQCGALVFHHGGHPIVDMRKAWATACRMAGVSARLFHDLRRSGVRDMIRAGVPPHVAMSISGHKTDSMLRRYAIISEADQRAALKRTEEFRVAEQERAAVTMPARVQ
jgi:integrase